MAPCCRCFTASASPPRAALASQRCIGHRHASASCQGRLAQHRLDAASASQSAQLSAALQQQTCFVQLPRLIAPAQTATVHTQPGISQEQLCRRAFLALLPLAAASLSLPQQAAADEILEEIEASDDVVLQRQRKIPKAYRETIKQIIKGLRDAFEAEASGAKEVEVRRKGEPAKEAIKNFVGKWQEDPRVVDEPEHSEIKEVIRELSAFYQRNGQRKPLAADVRERILQRLAAAEAALPKEDDKKILGIL